MRELWQLHHIMNYIPFFVLKVPSSGQPIIVSFPSIIDAIKVYVVFLSRPCSSTVEVLLCIV